MPMAMLVVLVAMSLTAAMVPIVVNQVAGTRTVTNRTTALDVAQAGIDAAVAQLRSAGKTAAGSEDLQGDISSLPPCTGMSGSQVKDGPQFSVSLVYYGIADTETGTPAAKLSCPPTDVPGTAIITSTGTSVPGTKPAPGDSGTRTIQATYSFKINNENISGGAIQLAEPVVNPLCIDGGDNAVPDAGTKVTMKLCPEGGTGSQRFVYNTDLNIMLSGSIGPKATKGMCLQATYGSKAAVVFQPCAGRIPSQQWSLDNNSRFVASTTDKNGKTVTGSYCLNAASAGVPSDLILDGCNTASNRSVFRMQTSVGAGMASEKTNQVVNRRQFSRCLDVTNLNQKSDYMIVWFCKQDPNGAVAWNQQWTLPTQATSAADAVPGRIRTAGSDGAGYCLTPPATTAGYVTLTQCAATGTLSSNLLWTVWGKTGDYATSYRIVSSSGYCLTPTDLTVANPDTHKDGTAKVKIAACTSSDLQKWNAPANFTKPLAVTNTLEK